MTSCPACGYIVKEWKKENAYECSNCGKIGYIDRLKKLKSLDRSYRIPKAVEASIDFAAMKEYGHYIHPTSGLDEYTFTKFIKKIATEIIQTEATVTRGSRDLIIIEHELGLYSERLLNKIDKLQEEDVILVHGIHISASSTSKARYKIQVL